MQSLQGRGLEAQSNIQCYNAVMNPIGKAGLFVNGFVRWRDGRKCWIELGQSAMFGQLIIWDVTNQCLSKRQSLSSELKNTWTLKMSSLYVTFSKWKGSAENTGVQVSLVFKSGTGFKFYLSVAAAVFSASVPSEIVAGCIIPQLHGHERSCGNFMATSEESPFQSHCSYIRLSDEQQKNALTYLGQRKVVGIQVDIPSEMLIGNFYMQN